MIHFFILCLVVLRDAYAGLPVENVLLDIPQNIFLVMSIPDADSLINRVVLNEQPWYIAEDDAVAREIASPRNSLLKTLSIADIKIPAGTVIKEHHHIGMEEVYWISAGRGKMQIEGVVFEVRQGDAVIILSHERHLITNPFDEELRLHVYCNPPWAPEELYFGPIPEGEQLSPPQEPRIFAIDDQPWGTIQPGVQFRWIAAPENTPLSQLAVSEWLIDLETTYLSTPAEGVESVYFVLEGSMEVTIGETSKAFKPQETVVIAPGHRHQIRNISDTPVRLHLYENRLQ